MLVRMTARPINPSDLIPVRGAYAHRIALLGIPGYEGVGMVAATGFNVSNSYIGKRVLPLLGEGTWQDYVVTDKNKAILIPDTIADDEAAQMYINPVTALVTCQEKLQLEPGNTLLINASGSSIGRLYAQLAKLFGFTLIAVTRNARHTRALLGLGASYVIDTSVSALRETVMDITRGQGADAAIDSIGGKDGNALAACLRHGGQFITIGLLSGRQVDWAAIAEDGNVQAGIFHLRHWNANVSTAVWQETFRKVISYVEQGQLQGRQIDSIYKLEDVRQAIKRTKSGFAKGKVLLKN